MPSPALSPRALAPLCLAALCWALLSQARASDAAPPPLPTLHAAANKTSVSGLSSGGFMTVQYTVAFSASVIGAGVIAGGPYHCAAMYPPAFPLGTTTCMSGYPQWGLSWASAQSLAALDLIDPMGGLAKMKLYLFSGKDDKTVHQPVMDAARYFFIASGVKLGNIAYVNDMPAGHAFLSPGFGNRCATSDPHFINQCAIKRGSRTFYDQPQAILTHIHGPLQPAAATLSSTVQPFNQREFADASSSMDDTGYVYIPKSCADDAAQCSVHVVFHGCRQGARTENTGDAVYGKVGYNRWADTNRLIVLYPQAMTSEPTTADPTLPFNPKGCWDWWGYTGTDFAVRKGKQLSAVKAMVDRLTRPAP